LSASTPAVAVAEAVALPEPLAVALLAAVAPPLRAK
jgi:hypothetical protein